MLHLRRRLSVAVDNGCADLRQHSATQLVKATIFMPMRMLNSLRKHHPTQRQREVSRSEVFDHYVVSMPTQQNAVDLVEGWNCAFPPEFGVAGGELAAYQDPRIGWMLEKYGSTEHRSVLELGPLEGGHTVMMERSGAAQIDAIEANSLAYLRCLITKEIFGLTRSHFWLGDFVKWMENSEKRYDLVIASGVLYHSNDPLHLLELIARRTDSAFIWTHFVDDVAMPADDPRRQVISREPQIQHFRGIPIRTYKRTYLNAQQHAKFCGGPTDEHRWLNRDDMLAALRAVGFTDISVAHEEPDHQFGPAMSIFATK
ncbi:class I SAM-dependent methyltransferase [Labrys okinawensis]|uniref:class I SAM-dependent methyltransferase n=1 Tax=Labrys okinawensis TaxID=346911 RepID=UPI0039BCD529